MACQNENNYVTEEVFRQVSPLPEYDPQQRPGAYGRPPNAFSKCPVCGGDTGVCRCTQAGVPPYRDGGPGPRPTPDPLGPQPGSTDFSSQADWSVSFGSRERERKRQRDEAAKWAPPEQTAKQGLHAYRGNLLGFGACKECGMGRIANVHL
jgi:hypothetical protein